MNKLRIYTRFLGFLGICIKLEIIFSLQRVSKNFVGQGNNSDPHIPSEGVLNELTMWEEVSRLRNSKCEDCPLRGKHR